MNIHTPAFTMQSSLIGNEIEVEVRGQGDLAEIVVLIEDEWVDASTVLTTDEFYEAVQRAEEPADTCHYGN